MANNPLFWSTVDLARESLRKENVDSAQLILNVQSAVSAIIGGNANSTEIFAAVGLVILDFLDAANKHPGIGKFLSGSQILAQAAIAKEASIKIEQQLRDTGVASDTDLNILHAAVTGIVSEALEDVRYPPVQILAGIFKIASVAFSVMSQGKITNI